MNPSLTQVARWADHMFKLTLGPSLDTNERLAWQRTPCVESDAREVLRRVDLLANTGHGHLASDEHAKMMIAAARGHAVALDLDGASNG